MSTDQKDLYHNPIDVVLIDVVRVLNPVAYKLGFTPNTITSISLVFGLAFNFFYACRSYKASVLMLFFSYFFDCMDGHYARTYNMETEFGDYYDHIKDILVMLLFGYLVTKNDDVPFIYKSAAFAVALFLSIHVFMEVACPKEDSKQVNGLFRQFQGICDSGMNRYFDSNTFHIFIALFILAHGYM